MAEKDRLHPADVCEGDRVTMKINPHNYNRTGYELTGTVIDAPRDDDTWVRTHLREGERLMVDFAVESDDGEVWRWNVDNGYVIGPVDQPGRPSRSDIGTIAGLFKPQDE